MSTAEIMSIIELVKREVVPAVGCTEPIAVALCSAISREVLGAPAEKVEVMLSPNVFKNALGVGIPGTDGEIGISIAVALGVLAGDSSKRLEILNDITPEQLSAAKKMVADRKISIDIDTVTKHMLYIQVTTYNGPDTAVARIEDMHTNCVYQERNGKVLFDNSVEGAKTKKKVEPQLSLRKIFDFATETEFDEIKFILEAARINKEAANMSFKHNYGHGIGRMLFRDQGDIMIGDTLFSRMLAYTSAACDARMAGANVPIMSNSGSGNQGASATLPLVVYAENKGCSDDHLARALLISHAIVIYIKQNLGRLSALCGCVVASSGTACGLVYLMGGGYDQMGYALKNMIANITGMICDGAKPSCSMKIASGTATAIFSAMMAVDDKYVTAHEGIIDEDVDKCVENLARIGKVGMAATDRLILEIMTGKQKV